VIRLKRLKRLILILVVLCLVSASFLNNNKVAVAAGTTKTVSPPDQGGDFNKIQDAINNANPGDTILVRRGIYNESIVVNVTRVTLIGEDRDKTVIMGGDMNYVVSIVAENVGLTNLTIIRSAIRLNSYGILVVSGGNEMSQNNITGNDRGIMLQLSSSNTISDNIIAKNNYGISLYSSNFNMISNNDVSSNTYEGIDSSFSHSNWIVANTVSLNGYDGIKLYSSSNNQIWYNSIAFNKKYGIDIDYSASTNTNVFLNNFNNLQQVSLGNSVSAWSYEDEGNYWSDYNGTDIYSGPYQNETGADGIGDTAYVMDANNRDSRPLMGIFSVLYIPLAGVRYPITVVSNSTISELGFETRPETGDKVLHFKAEGADNTTGFCRIMIPVQLTNYSFIMLADEEEIVPTFLNVTSDQYVYLYFTYLHDSDISIVSSKTQYLLDTLQTQVADLQATIDSRDAEYNELLKNYTFLFGNYTMLQNDYQQHLSDYLRNVDNIQNIMYIFAATTAIFMITTVYLSKVAHLSLITKKKESKTE